MTKKTELLDKAKTLPRSPGCYLMKNVYNEVIYVGKAKNLKNRVKTYFDASEKYSKTQALVKRIKDFEIIMTESEMESLILENNLIKQYTPKYNIRLRDDKTYPYLEINLNESFPRLIYTRKPKKKKNIKIYGPFPEGSYLKSTIKTLTKVYNLRDCSLTEFRSRKTPCILHQIHQCSAPCVDKISKENYHQDLKEVEKFFSSDSKRKKIIKNLEDKMINLSNSQEFEKAILLRDSLSTLKLYNDESIKQKVEFQENLKDIDLFSYHYSEEEIDLAIYEIRNSLLIGAKNIHLINQFKDSEEFYQNIPSIILQYYSKKNTFPDYLILDLEKNTEKKVAEALKKISKSKIKVVKPGNKFRTLFETTHEYARNSQRMRKENYQNILKGLKKLKDLLTLDELPRDLECYDIAVWQGQSPTAAQITFKDGKPDKKNYRYFHLTERLEGNNDFAMMEEVLERRLKYQNLPDVFIVDGGKLQVNSFKKILNKHQLKIPVVGIAKSRLHPNYKNDLRNKSEERLVIPGRTNPYTLKKNIELFRIVTQMRDEAHRFSRKLHHKQEKKKFIHSDLSEIPGVGKITIKKILSVHTGNIYELGKLSIQDIMNNFSLSEKVAQKIYNYFNETKDLKLD